MPDPHSTATAERLTADSVLDDREALVARYQAARQRTRELFAIPSDDAYYARPISLRHPLVFYEGHLPAFSVITLVKNALGRPGVDERLETLFARGIDPESEAAARASSRELWPRREEVLAYGRAADSLIAETLRTAELADDDNPHLIGGEAVFTILEHELMHQETFLYMLHQLKPEEKRGIAPPPPAPGKPLVNDLIDIPAGVATLGADRGEIVFGWDNEHPRSIVRVPVFSVQRHKVTNAELLEFVDAGGYAKRELWSDEAWAWIGAHAIAHPQFWEQRDGARLWRGFYGSYPLPLHAPVYVTHAEAEAYAKWRGMRLPSEAEYHRAAYGTPSGDERVHPWGDAPPDATRGVFDFASFDPQPGGMHPAGASAWGVEELVGNGWEWTSTVFHPFPGFSPMPTYPQYSADFFDDRHYVMKGASPVTARQLIRRSFRNWFRPVYPYVYAGFRCVK
jgi:iron(II)-dependent oxidoreductase